MPAKRDRPYGHPEGNGHFTLMQDADFGYESCGNLSEMEIQFRRLNCDVAVIAVCVNQFNCRFLRVADQFNGLGPAPQGWTRIEFGFRQVELRDSDEGICVRRRTHLLGPRQGRNCSKNSSLHKVPPVLTGGAVWIVERFLRL
jgi:hypothetical protein